MHTKRAEMERALAALSATASPSPTTNRDINGAQDERDVDITNTEQISQCTVNEAEDSGTTAQAAGSTTEDSDGIIYLCFRHTYIPMQFGRKFQ